METDSKPKENIIERVAHVFSYVFSPMLSPTYGVVLAMALSYLALLGTRLCLAVDAIVFVITCVIPMAGIFALWKGGYIKDPGLNERTERTVPFILTIVCYIGCALYLHHANAPSWLWTFPAGGAVATLACLFINLRWKISGHLAGMGGVTAVLFRMAADNVALHNLTWWIIGAIIVSGCVASSRIILGRHTLMQTLAGFALGFLSVYLISAI